MNIDLFNGAEASGRLYGWVGVLDRDATKNCAGGWFFDMPSGLDKYRSTISGTITASDIDATIESLVADEIDPPVGLDRDEAEALVRETLAKYVA